jgi:hypothetical protein
MTAVDFAFLRCFSLLFLGIVAIWWFANVVCRQVFVVIDKVAQSLPAMTVSSTGITAKVLIMM